MKINATRLQQHFETMSEIGKIGETGSCRPILTTIHKRLFDNAAEWIKDAGMNI